MNTQKIQVEKKYKYSCIACKFNTNKTSNIIAHNKTKKHLDKITLIAKETKTAKKLTSSNKIKELENHFKELEYRCKELEKQLDNQSKEFESRYKNLETLHNKLKIKYKSLKKSHQELEFNNKLNEKVKEMTEKNLIINSNTGNIYSNSNILNIILNADKALEYQNPFVDETTGMPHNYNYPAERGILADNPNATTEIKAKLCNAYVFYEKYNDKKLMEYLINGIVATYKKEDPKDQIVWTTDTARATYNLRLQNDKTKQFYWHTDKKGETLKQMVIQPMLLYVYKAIECFQQYYAQKSLTDLVDFKYPYSKEVYQICENFKSGMDIDMELDNNKMNRLREFFRNTDELQICIFEKKFSEELVNKMAGKFHLDKNKFSLQDAVSIVANINQT